MNRIGDAHILYKCHEKVVVPRLENTCFRHAPVNDINGRKFFLHSETKILLSTSPTAPCKEGHLPVYQTIRDDLIIIQPNVVKVHDTEVKKPKKGISDSFLYPQRILINWLENIFIENIDKYFLDAFGERNGVTALPENNEYFNELSEKLEELRNVNIFKFDWGLKSVGNVGGIMMVCYTAFKILKCLILFSVKICVIYNQEVGIVKSVVRSVFSSLYVISQQTAKEKQSGDGA